MLRRAGRCCAIALTMALLMAAATPPALACACCSFTGSRTVEVVKMDSRVLEQIGQMRFAKEAELSAGEADIVIKGIDDPATQYQLTLAREKDRMVFTLRDDKGRSGTLVLALPAMISIFEVDPRGEEKDKGSGPSLYKEWKLTANAAGGGLFRQVAGKGQKITLIFHGHGRGCTDAGHFTDWSLLVYGPAGKFTLIGALDSAGQ
jgi:hypothetical protein